MQLMINLYVFLPKLMVRGEFLLLLGCLITNMGLGAEIPAYEEYVELKESETFSAAKMYQLYELEAMKGDTHAKFMSFVVYYEHLSELKNYGTDAINYLASAARDGLLDAQYYLGLILSDNKLLPINYGLSNSWLRKASDKGSDRASFLLARNLVVEFRSYKSDDPIFKERENEAIDAIARLKPLIDSSNDPQVSVLVGALYFYNLKDQKLGLSFIWDSYKQGNDLAYRMINEFKVLYKSLNSEELNELREILGAELWDSIYHEWGLPQKQNK